MKIVSIIIPVYNVAPYLRECLDSLLAQTLPNWEAICIDDGSSDGSGGILDEYGSIDQRIRVVHQVNQGVVAARQAGFFLSKGDIVLFLDGDDMLDCGAVETILRHSFDNPDILQFGYRYMRHGTEIKKQVPIFTGSLTRDSVCRLCKRSPLDVLGMCVGDKCYTHEIVGKTFQSIGHVRIAHSEDGLFALSAFWHSNAIKFIGDVLYDYRIRDMSASRVFNPKIVDYKEVFVKKATEIARDIGNQSNDFCRREFDCHARESLGNIFVVALGKGVGFREAYRLLRQMSAADFFIKECSDWNPVKHKMMRFFVRFPSLFVLARGLLRMCIKRRCQV